MSEKDFRLVPSVCDKVDWEVFPGKNVPMYIRKLRGVYDSLRRRQPKDVCFDMITLFNTLPECPVSVFMKHARARQHDLKAMLRPRYLHVRDKQWAEHKAAMEKELQMLMDIFALRGDPIQKHSSIRMVTGEAFCAMTRAICEKWRDLGLNSGNSVIEGLRLSGIAPEDWFAAWGTWAALNYDKSMTASFNFADISDIYASSFEMLEKVDGNPARAFVCLYLDKKPPAPLPEKPMSKEVVVQFDRSMNDVMLGDRTHHIIECMPSLHLDMQFDQPATKLRAVKDMLEAMTVPGVKHAEVNNNFLSLDLEGNSLESYPIDQERVAAEVIQLSQKAGNLYDKLVAICTAMSELGGD